MWTKLLAGLALAGGVAYSGVTQSHRGRSECHILTAPISCCSADEASCCPDGDCCPNGACCEGKAKAESKADCCFPGSPCCVPGGACCGGK